MRLVEIIVGMVILLIVMIGGVTLFSISKVKYLQFIDKLQADSVKISLYNYSNYLIDTLNTGDNGFIYYSGNQFMTGNVGDYAYSCDYRTGDVLETLQKYDGIFCRIRVEDDYIYNYKIIE